MSPELQISPGVAENYCTDLRTLVRLSHDGDKPLTDEECDKILAENAELARKREEDRLNMPILPQRWSDEYTIIKKDIPYGGTIGNPVTEGIQKVVTLEVSSNYDLCRVNFHNKEELNKLISELQQVSDHLD
jgi:hypothetical protein